MSEIKCPKCNKGFLFLVIEHKHIFSVKDIGTEDIIPDEKVDAEGKKYLECMKCNWTGWTDQYFEVKEGIIPLFSGLPEGKYEDVD